MHRYRLTIEYDGGPFVGWQRQNNGRSVQQALEEAVFRFCGEQARVHGAGRTDTGVHALGQVAHLDLQRAVSVATLRNAVNFHLRPEPVAVLEALRVPGDFHARFSACRRTYLYRILDRAAPPALARGRVCWVPFPLDVGAMAEAAQLLVGRHDFSAFRSSMCQATSALKTLDVLKVHRAGEEIHMLAQARSFLHNQVRIIAGSLKRIGEGKWQAGRLADALASRDRCRAGPTAPAHALYLVAVGYPPAGGSPLVTEPPEPG